ncbi:MAG: response regulator [Myxococcales bacterium]|nr:response regulator [Myxococcales bacterium]
MDFRSYPILYVDDENPNRVVMKHNLKDEFDLILAESGEQALQILESKPIAVLLADQRMPNMTGVELCEQVRPLYPDVERVIITAYSDLQATVDAINRGRVARFIKKPWTTPELVSTLRDSIRLHHQRKVTEQLEMKLIQFDRMANLGLAAMGVAHDLKQPLAVIVPSLDSAQFAIAQMRRNSGVDARTLQLIGELQEAVSDIREGVGMLRHLSDAVIDMARHPAGDATLSNALDVIQSALRITRTTIQRKGRLTIELPDEPVYFHGSASRLAQLVVNLLINATQSFRHTKPRDNWIRLELEADETMLTISVSDNGCGIANEHRENVFSPLYTTKGREGTGVGLAICRQVAQELNGSVDFESEVDQGTRFMVRIPRASNGTKSLA